MATKPNTYLLTEVDHYTLNLRGSLTSTRAGDLELILESIDQGSGERIPFAVVLTVHGEILSWELLADLNDAAHERALVSLLGDHVRLAPFVARTFRRLVAR